MHQIFCCVFFAQQGDKRKQPYIQSGERFFSENFPFRHLCHDLGRVCLKILGATFSGYKFPRLPNGHLAFWFGIFLDQKKHTKQPHHLSPQRGFRLRRKGGFETFLFLKNSTDSFFHISGCWGGTVDPRYWVLGGSMLNFGGFFHGYFR